eukprot:NODE_3043_length_1289_cov_85.101201_g2888_i0.p1 GENE.NODE_3043_length_1289_cov_85.101201_g2888_i0~~NODE_3043_length_1289_cov_85.101201_g2888_i0.p1  ORF type:complete len:349 (+),score=101.13 NODE_3043_length_1289_cov_85.101201_g2888_i0:65-1111(+)
MSHNAGSDARKVFCGGLAPMTSKESLQAHFGQYGEVADAIVLMDPQGVPRGFGFVTFATEAGATAATVNRRQLLDGKDVEVKMAGPRPGEAGAGAEQPQYKVFVGGLPHNVTREMLETWFKQFGAIAEVILPNDPISGGTKGYGFINFEKQEAMEAALKHTTHLIGDKTADVKQAQARRPQDAAAAASEENRKVFVGGLPQGIQQDEIKQHFAQFGNVTDVFLATDQATGKLKGFAFVTFEDDNGAQAALVFQGHSIGGKNVDVKPSNKRAPAQNPMMQQMAMWGAYMGYPAPGAMYGQWPAAAPAWGAAPAAPQWGAPAAPAPQWGAPPAPQWGAPAPPAQVGYQPY